MLTWEYRDPCEVAERRQLERQRKRQREAEQCGKCAYRASMPWDGQTIDTCTKRRPYGWRCWLFKESA
ncbi:MAG: hypothetical protein FWF20_11990 [Betaproteobacteria bacterium]|nr:hypothetical protein [Betaproteobacteria bacterium]